MTPAHAICAPWITAAGLQNGLPASYVHEFLGVGDAELEDAAARAQQRHGGGDGGPALRLGMRLVKGLRQEDAERITAAVVAHGPLASIEALQRASSVSVSALRRLVKKRMRLDLWSLIASAHCR